MANEILKTVLSATIGEHITAFRSLTDANLVDIVTARKALREWIGTQEKTSFRNIDDVGILCVLLEEFANYAIFFGEELQRENAGIAMQKPGNA